MSETISAGWHPDPLGRHAHRYHDGSDWTEHVADEAASAPSPPATAVAPAAVAVPGTAAVVTLPDTEEAARRRRLWGGAMIAVAAAMVVAGAPAWVSGSGPGSTSLTGYAMGGGGAVAFFAVLLGVYGLQAFKRPRVRYNVAALLIVIMSVATIFTSYASLTDEQVLELAGEDAGATAEPDFELGPVQVVTGSSRADEARTELETGLGLQLAFVLHGVALVPLIALWREDRQRRRDAGLLL